MQGAELDRRFADLKARCAKLRAADQDAALDALAQVLTAYELQREASEAVSLSISIRRPSQVTNLSG